MAAVVAFAATAATATTVRSLVVTAGIQVALSVAAKKLAGSENLGQPVAIASPQQVTNSGSVIPRSLAYGTVTKAGSVIFHGTAGAQNRDLWEVHAFVGHEIESFDALYVEGYEAINLATDLDVSGYCTLDSYTDTNGEQLLQVFPMLGGVDQAAIPELVAAFPGVWTNNHRARGVAYVALRYRFDFSPGSDDPDNAEKSVWERGKPPNIRATLRGKKVYDPRIGAQSPTDANTWTFNDNAALCCADYLRAHPDPRVTGTFGDSYTRIDYASTAVAADVCDQAVTVPNGLGGITTEKRYTIDASLSLDTQASGVYEVFRSCMAGSVAYTGGIYSLFAGSIRPSVATIDGSWLAGSVSKQAGATRNQRINTVRGQYVSSTALGQLIDFNPISDATLVARDGEALTDELTMSGVSGEYRAQRLGRLHLREKRSDSILNMACNLRALQLSISDFVEVDLPELGAVGSYQVEGWELSRIDPTPGSDAPGVFLKLRETHPDGYDIAIGDLTGVPAIQSLAQSDFRPPPVVSGTALAGVGSIVLEWVNPPQIDIDRIEIWSSGTNNRATATKRSQTKAEEFVDVVPNNTTRYYWLIVYGRNGLTSEWFPSSATAGITATSIEVTGGADAVSVSLFSNLEKFSFDADGSPNPGSQVATLTVDRQNITTNPSWTTAPSVTLGGAANATVRTLSVADFGANTTVTVTATVGSFVRSYIIGRTINGDDAVLPSGTPLGIPISGDQDGVSVTTDATNLVKIETTGTIAIAFLDGSSMNNGSISVVLQRRLGAGSWSDLEALVLGQGVDIADPGNGDYVDIFSGAVFNITQDPGPAGTYEYRMIANSTGTSGTNFSIGVIGSINLTRLKG